MADDEWREVDEEVGLSDEPWWETADDREHVEPPVRPEDRSWHEREDGDDHAPGRPSVQRDAAEGLWASLDGTQRVVLFAFVGLGVLLALVAVTYAFVLTGVSGPQTDPPQANFDATYDAERGAVVLEHAGGEAVAADRVAVVVDGSVHGDWSASAEELDSGDAVTVRDVPPDASGTLEWRDPERDVRVPLATF